MILFHSQKLAGKQLFESSIRVEDFLEKRKKSTIVSRFALDYAAYLHFRLELTNITLFLYFFTLSKMKTNITKVCRWQKRFPGSFVGG